MTRRRRDAARGLLNLAQAEDRVRLERYLPGPRLDAFVEHYWVVRWDLRGQPPFTSESLPYPSVHVVLEPHDSRVQGVPTGRFRQTLADQGLVFGIKFRPGGFRPWLGASVATLTDRRQPLDQVLPFGPALDRAVLADTVDDAVMVERCEAELTQHAPVADPQVEFISALVARVAGDRTLVQVEQLAASAGLSKRALERLFQDYVGISPKWVIQRYRLFEAAERLASGAATGAQLAQELGYFDQAHFSRDFKAMVGLPPRAFSRQAGLLFSC